MLLSSDGNKLQEVQKNSALTTPELVLLSKFQTPSPPRAYGVNVFWEGFFGEASEKVIQRFISQGLIIKAPAETDVNNLSVKEIRTHLKTLGMIVSGKREELVRRLAAVANPEILTPPPDKRLWLEKEKSPSYSGRQPPHPSEKRPGIARMWGDSEIADSEESSMG